MQQLLNLFPFIEKSKQDFEEHNKLLNKVTLTGKINADTHTTNLFEFAEKTSYNFSLLKEKLINILLKKNIDALTQELQFKANVTINILIRNLFERTADVGFLATDTKIIEFLNNSNNTSLRNNLQQRLHEYALKYSVYNEIIIFDTLGNVMVNLNENNNISFTNDPIIKKTLESDDFVERLAPTDIFKSQKQTLTYTQKIIENGNTIGILCLCFKFEDELQRIFTDFQDSKETILLVQNNHIIASNRVQEYSLNTHFKKIKGEYSILKNTIAVSAKASPYQGYNGLDWFSVIINNTKEPIKKENKNLVKYNLLNEEIVEIIDEANYIVEDLSDIIINGELIAAKRRIYVINPILDSLRIVSSNLLTTIENAGNNLESLLQKSLKFNLISSSQLAVNIMDRNLYERANDSRWWALTPLFIKELSNSSPNTQELNNVLNYINDLYTVYTNIFIYDKNGKIIASSKEPNIIGQQIHAKEVSVTLQNKNAQHYFVSDFEKTKFYQNEATYIYHASINNDDKTIGGIAIVFDSSVEFKAILQDSFPSEYKGLGLFITSNGIIIASTDDTLKPTMKLSIDQAVLQKINANKTYYDKVDINNKSYLLASTLSLGYREYKTSDNYKNNVFALTLYEL
jgi:hypothetical protein